MTGMECSWTGRFLQGLLLAGVVWAHGIVEAQEGGTRDTAVVLVPLPMGQVAGPYTLRKDSALWMLFYVQKGQGVVLDFSDEVGQDGVLRVVLEIPGEPAPAEQIKTLGDRKGLVVHLVGKESGNCYVRLAYEGAAYWRGRVTYYVGSPAVQRQTALAVPMSRRSESPPLVKESPMVPSARPGRGGGMPAATNRDVGVTNLQALAFSRTLSGFGYKSWKVDGKMSAALGKLVPVLRRIEAHPDRGQRKISVVGHADATGPETPEGEKPGNLEISRRRAQAVVDHLVGVYGFSPDLFEVTARGASEPLTPDGRAAVNRRVELRFSP